LKGNGNGLAMDDDNYYMAIVNGAFNGIRIIIYRYCLDFEMIRQNKQENIT